MKIYVIGDSISIQYGPCLQEYLRGIMDYARKDGDEEALLNLDHPQGANAGDSTMVLAFLRAKAPAGGIHADMLLVNCGLHDLRTDPKTGKKQVPLDRYEANLRAILETVRQWKTTFVWMRTTPCDEKVHNRPHMEFYRFAADCDAYNAVADRVMADARVPVIDLFTFTRNLGPDLYCDHVHFKEHVRKAQAAYIAGWLAAWIQTNSRQRHSPSESPA